jgi:hypothetical protein
VATLAGAWAISFVCLFIKLNMRVFKIQREYPFTFSHNIAKLSDIVFALVKIIKHFFRVAFRSPGASPLSALQIGVCHSVPASTKLPSTSRIHIPILTRFRCKEKDASIIQILVFFFPSHNSLHMFSAGLHRIWCSYSMFWNAKIMSLL